MVDKVLVLEDDKSVSRMLGFCLRRAGFDVVQAQNGEEALARLATEPIAVVVMHLRLPDGKGKEVIEKLRLLKQRNGRPAFIVTSALDEAEAYRSYGLARDRFLSKPFNPWDLVKILDEMLGCPGIH